jgi:membrane associated rhomboid family serine protease
MNLIETLKSLLVICSVLAVLVLGARAGMYAKSKRFETASCASVAVACLLAICLTWANPDGSPAYAAGVAAGGYFAGWLLGLVMFPAMD